MSGVRSRKSPTRSFRDTVRLRHRRRGIGGLCAREPALRGPGNQRVAGGGRRPGHQSADRDADGVRRAVGRPGDSVALPHPPVRSVTAGRVLGAGQDARRVELGQRHGVQPRHARGLRRARAARQPGVGLGRHAAGLQADRGQRPRCRRCARLGRPAAGLNGRRERPAARRRHQRRDPARLAAYARPQRERRGTHRLRDGDDPRRPAVQRGRRVPAPGHGPSQPDRRAEHARRPSRARAPAGRSACAGARTGSASRRSPLAR